MPMAIAPENWEKWLDPGNQDVADLRALMAPPQCPEPPVGAQAIADPIILGGRCWVLAQSWAADTLPH